MQTDYLTFDNLITTSDTPKVQSSEAIAVEEYLLKLWGSIDGFLPSHIIIITTIIILCFTVSFVLIVIVDVIANYYYLLNKCTFIVICSVVIAQYNYLFQAKNTPPPLHPAPTTAYNYLFLFMYITLNFVSLF